jgi:GH15 family glucan-1,4-alpha-glucosidase
MTFEPTGAIVSSPTCSLPEDLGGVRNWDYRFTWIRDSAFTVYAFLRLGFKEEARAYMRFLEQRALEGDENGPLQVMYRIGGGHQLDEEILGHLEGYRGSGPVRVGNGAATQLQLDIYGELMDAVFLFNKYAEPISYDFWQHMRQIMAYVADNYHKPDEGIWEVRGGRQHFVYSKMQCWIALDRGMRLASARGLPIDRDRIRVTKDRLYDEIMEKGWDKERRTFTQSYGSKKLDASNLIMPLIRFISSTDPRMLGTIDAIMENLVSDSLVYRYELDEDEKMNHDGLAGQEGTFSMCTFWLAEALSRAGRVSEGREIFEKMLTYSNHLGLYSEEIGPQGEALGNFPQAFTHLGLISAAYELDRALGGKS